MTSETVVDQPPGAQSDVVLDDAEGIIRTVGLTKRYSGTDFNAVEDLSLTVRRGEIFGLLGPNGAGKTTFAGMLSTRVIPTAGRAYVGGIDVVGHPSVVRQLEGVVSQQNTLDRALTVWENLYYHGRLFGISSAQCKAIADELLEKFHLSKWATSSVYALSGGMAQRLMIARAIFHRPAVLFMDEPTSGFDPQGRLALWEILRELNRIGQTVLLATHNMEEADQLCDRVAIIDHGKLLALDTPQRLKDTVDADTVVTIRADGDIARFETLIQRELDGVTWTRRVESVVEAHRRGTSPILPAINGIAERHGYTVLDLSISAPTLETVFIALTGKDLRD